MTRKRSMVADRLAAYAHAGLIDVAARQAEALELARHHQGRGLIEQLAQRHVVRVMRGNDEQDT